MDAREFLQAQIGRQRWIADRVLGDLTEEQVNWNPPGAMNRIGALLLHAIGSDDVLVHRVCQGKARVWDSGNWRERVGFPDIPGPRGYWPEAKAATFALAPLLEYQAAVRAAVDEYVANLTGAELARTVSFVGGEQPIAMVLGTMVVHAAGHIGEIAALKGAQGAKGLPF